MTKYLTPAEQATELIKQHGVFGLCANDGCSCCHFKIHNISVDISCVFADIRVYSSCHTQDELESVAIEVVRSLSKSSILCCIAVYRIRFNAPRLDHHNGRSVNGRWLEEYLCSYCSEKRADRHGYLCGKCLLVESAKRSFPWTSDGFMNPEFSAEFAAICEKATE